MSRMFKTIDRTWNVFVGCRFDCTYCNARKAALTRFKHMPRYEGGFTPHLVESELTKTFKPGEFVFVGYMGDITFASYDQRSIILNRIRQFPDTTFLLISRHPAFHTWGFSFPNNVMLGTTLETNINHHLSKAPTPHHRFGDLYHSPSSNPRFISIEPIMDFDIDKLTKWCRLIRPQIIEVGADNYHNNLPEPPPEKLEQLLVKLREICPNVIEKDGLSRLKERR